MNLRQVAASISVSALAVVGLQLAAGAAEPTFTVSDTTIPAGGSVTIHLTEPCLHPNGDPEYGDVITSTTGQSPVEIDHQETKGDHFDKGGTGVVRFDTPGTYTITRFCDTPGMLDQVTITVTAPTVPTTTTTTTAAPTSTTTTTAKPGTTTTTVKAAATTTTTTAKPSTTTTTRVSTKVAGVSTTKATGATRVASTVSYTG